MKYLPICVTPQPARTIPKSDEAIFVWLEGSDMPTTARFREGVFLRTWDHSIVNDWEIVAWAHIPPIRTDKEGAATDISFSANEITALSNSPVALMALVDWWTCREVEDEAFSGKQVTYKVRRDELTERARSFVRKDPECWPSDLVKGLGFPQNGVSLPVWYAIDGNLHGYDGEVVIRHRDGSNRIGSTSWIDTLDVETPRGMMPAWKSCLRDGYLFWTPIR